MNKISIGTWSTRHYPYPQTKKVFDWAKEKGFDGIEIIDSWIDFYSMGVEEIKKLKREFNIRNLETSAITASSLTFTEPKLARKSFSKVEKAFEVAGMLESRIVNLCLWQTVPPKTSLNAKEKHYEALAENISKLADKAKTADIELSIELHEGTIVDTSDALIKVLNMVNKPNVGANPDLGNWLFMFPKPYEPWQETLKKLAKYTTYWHVKTFCRVHFPKLNDSQFIEVPLPFGDIDYRRAFPIILNEGYDGYIVVETQEEGDPFDFLETGKHYIEELLKEWEKERSKE